MIVSSIASCIYYPEQPECSMRFDPVIDDLAHGTSPRPTDAHDQPRTITKSKAYYTKVAGDA
jgi:hypothetical protein